MISFRYNVPNNVTGKCVAKKNYRINIFLLAWCPMKEVKEWEEVKGRY